MVKGDYREGVITKPMGSPWTTFLWGGTFRLEGVGGGEGLEEEEEEGEYGL